MEIFIEQLKDGKREEFNVSLSPDFLDLHEPELSVTAPVTVKGVAYVADDLFIVEFSACTSVNMNCSICNSKTSAPLETQIFHTSSLEELTPPTFDLKPLLREEILLLIPQFIECQGGKCPERGEVAKFLKNSDAHFPFADL